MAEYTPVRPKAGGLVHATSMTSAHRTACNRICAGWVVALDPLTCQRCKDIIGALARGVTR